MLGISSRQVGLSWFGPWKIISNVLPAGWYSPSPLAAAAPFGSSALIVKSKTSFPPLWGRYGLINVEYIPLICRGGLVFDLKIDDVNAENDQTILNLRPFFVRFSHSEPQPLYQYVYLYIQMSIFFAAFPFAIVLVALPYRGPKTHQIQRLNQCLWIAWILCDQTLRQDRCPCWWRTPGCHSCHVMRIVMLDIFPLEPTWTSPFIVPDCSVWILASSNQPELHSWHCAVLHFNFLITQSISLGRPRWAARYVWQRSFVPQHLAKEASFGLASWSQGHKLAGLLWREVAWAHFWKQDTNPKHWFWNTHVLLPC